jgi:hypothetical protein
VAAVQIDALGLAIGPFVPIKPDPLHAFDDGLDGFVRGPALVGVFNAQDKNTVLLAGIEPIEQGGSDTADVEVACGARGKSYSDMAHLVLAGIGAKVGIYNTR